MKTMRKILSLLLVCLMMMSTLAACGAEKEPERSGRDRDREERDDDDEDEEEEDEEKERGSVKPEPDEEIKVPASEYDQELVEDIYTNKLIDIYYTLIDTNDYSMITDEDKAWIPDYGYAFLSEGKDPLCMVGYTIEDLSGDGLPELIITDVNDYDKGKTVFAIYTIKDDEIYNTVVGWGRSQNAMIGDGEMYFYGANGATEAAFGTYHLSLDGTEVIYDTFYFSTDNMATGKMEYYFSESGKWDPAVSEKLEVEDEDFWQLLTDLENGLLDIEVTPFYRLTTSFGPMAGSAVYLEYASDSDEDVDSLDRYETCDDEYALDIVVTPVDDISDFTFHTVEYGEDNGGEAEFTTTPVMEIGDLEAYKAIVITAAFPGSMPSCAISYTQSDGTERMLLLSMSGMDGSLEMTPLY